MATKHPAQTSMGIKKTSVRSIEKEYKVSLKTSSPNMNLTTYMKREGLPQMARLLQTVERASQPKTAAKEAGGKNTPGK
jgi:hypothetical protein